MAFEELAHKYLLDPLLVNAIVLQEGKSFNPAMIDRICRRLSRCLDLTNDDEKAALNMYNPTGNNLFVAQVLSIKSKLCKGEQL